MIPNTLKISALALALVMSSTSSFGATLQDLSTTLKQATKNDPQWASTVHGYHASKESIGIFSAGLKPQVSLSAEVSRENGYVNGSGENRYNQESYAATLVQPLFRLDQWHNHQKGNATEQQIDATFVADQQSFYMRVVKTYLDVLRSNENLQFRNAEKAAIKRQLEQTVQRFNVGLIANTDVQEAKAAYDISSVQQIIAEQDLALTLQNLETLTGAPIENVASLQANAPITPPSPQDISQWVETALANSPVIAAALHAKDVAQAEYKSKRSAHMPTLDLIGSYQDRDTTDESAFSQGDLSSSSVSIKLEIPIYSGGKISAERRQAKQLELQAEDNYNLRKREVIQNTRNLYRVVNTDVARVSAQKQSIHSAEEALKATEAGYDAGTRVIIDVLTAQQALYGAKRDYANARYDYFFDFLQLKQTTGTLIREDLAHINQWLVPQTAQ